MHQEFYSIQDLLAYAQENQTHPVKGFCRLGFATRVLTQAVAGLLAIEQQELEWLLDSDSIRHSLKQHGIAKSKSEAARGQIPIVEADILALAGWLQKATIVRAGQAKPGKQPRIELESVEATGTTTVIMEWRPARQQLALVTMYKKRPVA